MISLDDHSPARFRQLGIISNGLDHGVLFFAPYGCRFLARKCMKNLASPAKASEEVMKLWSLLTVCAAIAASGAARPVEAHESIAIGVLTCGVKGGPSFILGSRRELRCIFHGNSGDRGERYGGQIQKLGLDVGLVGNAQLSWTVLAPVRTLGPAALTGWYAGIGAGATVGVGAGANLLVGGSFNTISLQPLSVLGQTGLNASLAVASVELHPYFDAALPPEPEPPLK
jgi:hypothetical protein